MERLESALRRYRQLLPQPAEHGRLPLRALQVWLNEDVSAVLDEYVGAPRFREHAAWSIRSLRPGARTPERRLIELVDQRLVDCARALVSLSGHRRMDQKLAELFAGEPSGEKENLASSAQFDLAVQRRQIHAIAGRDWDDLVNVNDYFDPQQEWFHVDGGPSIQRGEWIVALNPELMPIGNFVVRCLLKRVELRYEVLSDFRQKCWEALSKLPSAYERDREASTSAWQDLSRSRNELNGMLRIGRENLLREACTAATQIYAAFHPRSDVKWLGLDGAIVDAGTEMLRSRINGLDNAHVFERIAVALGELRQLYGDEGPDQAQIDKAIGSDGLVIIDASRKAYWEGRPILKQPTGPAWKLLVALTKKARYGEAVEVRDIWGEELVGDSAMSTAWGRLKGCLPASLHRLVEPGDEPRTYRLKLDSDRIHLFV